MGLTPITCNLMKGKQKEIRRRETQGGEGDVKMKAETGVITVTNYGMPRNLGPPEATRSQKKQEVDSPLRTCKGSKHGLFVP